MLGILASELVVASVWTAVGAVLCGAALVGIRLPFPLDDWGRLALASVNLPFALVGWWSVRRYGSGRPISLALTLGAVAAVPVITLTVIAPPSLWVVSAGPWLHYVATFMAIIRSGETQLGKLRASGAMVVPPVLSVMLITVGPFAGGLFSSVPVQRAVGPHCQPGGPPSDLTLSGGLSAHITRLCAITENEMTQNAAMKCWTSSLSDPGSDGSTAPQGWATVRFTVGGVLYNLNMVADGREATPRPPFDNSHPLRATVTAPGPHPAAGAFGEVDIYEPGVYATGGWSGTSGTLIFGHDGFGNIDADLAPDGPGRAPVHISGQWTCGTPVRGVMGP